MRGNVVSIESVLLGLTLSAGTKNPEAFELASVITRSISDPRAKVEAIIDELHRRFKYQADPIQESVPRFQIEGGNMDVDEACLFVAVLTRSIGIPCRFVAAQYGRHWTCFLECEFETGIWERVDPLRQQSIIGKEPDRMIVGSGGP